MKAILVGWDVKVCELTRRGLNSALREIGRGLRMYTDHVMGPVFVGDMLATDNRYEQTGLSAVYRFAANI